MNVAGKACLLLVLLVCACASSREPTAHPMPPQWHAFRLNPELNPVVSPGGTMAVRWAYKTGGGISSSPTVSGETVFVASNDHRLYALDLRTGRLRWTFTADNQIMTAPLVVQDVIVVGEGDNYGTMFDPPNYLLLGKGPSGLFGVDAETGKERWRWSLPGSAMPTGAVVDGVYEQHDAAGMLFALNARDGRYRWRQYLRSTATMSAANNFRGHEVVTAGDYPNSVIAFDGTNGRIRWRTRFSDQRAAFDYCPQASDGRAIYGMYLARPSDSRFAFVGYTTPGIERAYALDGKNGKVIWDVPLARGTVPINNAAAIPLIYRDVMYLGSAIVPQVFAVDARSGKVRWRLHVAGPVKGGMVATAGRVYFGDLGGYVWAVDSKTGNVVGKQKMHDKFNVGSPIIVGQTLIIGGNKGYVFAIPLNAITRSATRAH
ncbi:MAG: PQQ-binding-like beta-propeller repeat protein [Candidatus Eremiobacteraeota bacterium]|nr:PQQ-binding-like beta-propeller repeat protein [Candidatus Eremiobacteraeota bacterium]